MSGFSATVQTAIANWIRGQNMPAAPTSLFLALSTSDIADDGTGFVEPTDGYVRQPVTMQPPVYINNIGTVIRNVNPVVFGAATASWGTVRAAALLDAAGNIILKGTFAAPRVVPAGDTCSFASGAVEFVVQ